MLHLLLQWLFVWDIHVAAALEVWRRDADETDDARNGRCAATPTSSFTSRLKPTAGRLRPNTAPTSS